MAFDFKKEYKEFYLPARKPVLVTVPKMNYIAVKGVGNPNGVSGEYQQSISILYTLAFTLKMSYKTDYHIEGYYPYVVPPLEGFWWQDGFKMLDNTNKDSFQWISVIRLPDFITKDNFAWAKETANKKKKQDCSLAEFLTYDEGLCVQCMHQGSYDNEPQTIALMEEYLQTMGYEADITKDRHHHEIYLSDPRRCKPDNLRTVIRYPIKKK